jgi:hypothetical protein
VARPLLRGGMVQSRKSSKRVLPGLSSGALTRRVQAVGRISELSHAICRHRFEERYDASRMVDNYLKVYRSLVA